MCLWKYKIEIGDRVKYLDNGHFPSLNNREGIVIDIDDHLGVKYLIVDFSLAKINFKGSLPYKRFKKLPMSDEDFKNKEKIRIWGELD